MNTHPTNKQLAQEVAFFTDHIDELSAKQQEERKAYFANPENAIRIQLTQQRMAIAEQLYQARHRAGLTQAELALKMQVSQPVIARLEKGRGNITCDTLSKYAAACGCLLSITLQ